MDLLTDSIAAFIRLSFADRLLVIYVLFLIGGVLGAMAQTGEIHLQRGAYFALAAICIALVMVQPAMYGDFVESPPKRPWLFATSLMVSVAAGSATAPIAKFRALDAFGSKVWGILAYVPFANLVLLFAPSRDRRSYTRKDSLYLLGGANGVIAGLIVFATTATIQHALTVGKATRLAQPGARIENTIELVGLRGALKNIADRMEPGLTHGPFTLTSSSAEGTTLLLTWQMPRDAGSFIPSGARIGIISGVCQDAERLGPLLAAGATVQMVYRSADGEDAGKLEITRASCGF